MEGVSTGTDTLAKEECDPKVLKEHFETHFDLKEQLEIPEEIATPPEYLKHLREISTDSIKQGPPDEEELKSAIKNSKTENHLRTVPQNFTKMQ